MGQDRIAPGVIWVTGFSGAGKTTVANELWQALDRAGAKAILLDGDELRDIYGAPYGYERADRVALGYVNFTMCRYLVAQGCTVVIAAAGMYEEVLAWNRAHIPNFIQVYLRVADAERRRRDAVTKKVYGQLSALESLYDEPTDPDLIVDNAGDMSARKAAAEILEFYLAGHRPVHAMDHATRYWSDHYAQDAVPEASDFVRWVLGRLPAERGTLLEIGCGRGADAALLSTHGWRVIAVDRSEHAIAACRAGACATVDFRLGDAGDVARELAGQIDVVLCRGVLDAVPRVEDAAILTAARQALAPGGMLALECASILDLMHRRGKAIGPGERMQERYRRYRGETELAHQLESGGFTVEAVEYVEIPREMNEPPQILMRMIARIPA